LTVVGLELCFNKTGLDMARKIWQSAHLVIGPGLDFCPGQVLHQHSNFAPTFPLLYPRSGQRTSVCCISSITTIWNARVFRAFNVSMPPEKQTQQLWKEW